GGKEGVPMFTGHKTSSFLAALTVALATISGLAIQAQRPSPEAKQHYAQAQELLSRGDKDKAFEELKAAIRLAPGFVEPQEALIDRQQDKAESLIEQYEAAVKEYPNSPLHHYLLGKVYSLGNKEDKADAEFQKAMDLDPDFGWALVRASDTAKRKGDITRSVEMLDRASKNAGDGIELRAMIAGRFNRRGMYDKAIDEAGHVLKIDPAQYEAYVTRWSARLNKTFGADETRAEVLQEIRDLELKHSKEIKALLAVRSAYQLLDDEKSAEAAKQAVLAIDPKYFERQDYSASQWISSGKVIRLTGAAARLLSDIWSMKDDKQKIEAYGKLETQVEDQDAKLYVIYPGLLRSYIGIKDLDNAERVMGLMLRGNIDAGELAQNRIAFARACSESKMKLDKALDLIRNAIEDLRKPAPKREGSSGEEIEYQKEHLKGQLAEALALEGKIQLEIGMAQEAVAALRESVTLSEQEDNLLGLGLAYSRTGKKQDAIDALARAYAFEGKRQKEARTEIDKIYAGMGSRPLAALLDEAVARHKEHARKVAMEKAAVELSKTKPQDAPLFQLATLGGQKVQLVDLRGKVVLLNFWATW